MKSRIKALFAMLLVVALLMSAVGCGSGDASSTNAPTNDNFFGVDENDIVSKNQGSADGSNNSENNGTASGSGTSNGNTGTSSGGKPVVQVTKTEGKSWKNVLASMPKDLRGTTITIWNWNPVSEYNGGQGVIDAFQKQTGITVKWKTVNFSQYHNLLASAIASDESPDIARTRTPNPVVLQNFQPLSVSGYDFTDAAWDQTTLKHYTYNGNTYAANLKNTPVGSVNILMYNTSLIDQYDLEDPYQLWKNGKWTWNKFIEICKKFKKEAKAKWAVSSNQLEGFYNIFGISAPIELQNGKFVNISTTERFVKVAQKLADFQIGDGLFNIESEAKAAFDKGEVLFFGDSAVFARTKNAFHAPLKQAGILGAVAFPTIEGQDKYYTGSGEYEAYGIVKGAKNAKAVPYFLRYFLDAENYDMNTYFGNKRVLEVYQWTMQQKNRIASITFNANTEFGETYDQGWYATLTKTDSSQIKSFLESYSNIIDSRAKEVNNALNNLK